MQIDRTLLATMCRQFGPLVKAPDGILGAQLLWALAGNESSFGQNITPRHENGYCYRGTYFDKAGTQNFGCLFHCSFGPWQIMAPNAVGYTPLELLNDVEIDITAVIAFLNREILGRLGAKTLDEIGDAYNSGNFRDANVPVAYIARLKTNYEVPLP